MRYLIAFLVTLFGSPAKAAISTGVMASGLSIMIGFDPVPWIAGAAGGAIVFLKTEHTSKRETAANGLISVMLGGFVAPWLVSAAEILTKDGSQDATISALVNNNLLYAFCFILAAFWPILYRIIWPAVVKKYLGEQK